MTAPTPDRVGEIIAAYGADTARWPGGERAGALARIAADAGLRADLAEAARLDADLAVWALSGAEVRRRVPLPRAPRWRWWGGGIAAAGIAAGLVAVVVPSGVSPRHTASSAATASADRGGDAFAYVFTPTDDEESLI